MSKRRLGRRARCFVGRLSRALGLAPLVGVLVLPLVVRAEPIASIPALEPLGRSAGERVVASVGHVLRTTALP